MGGLNVLNLGMRFKKWMSVDRWILFINTVEHLNSWLRAMLIRCILQMTEMSTSLSHDW